MSSCCKKVGHIEFPKYTGLRCLMMPYIQGVPESVPDEYDAYRPIIKKLVIEPGKVGFLTIDESLVVPGQPQRGQRAKFGRPIHTEAGYHRSALCWGTTTWGGNVNVRLDQNVRVLIANDVDASCAVWDAEHPNTSIDGDIGYAANDYPYETAYFLRPGEVFNIGILTPHESLPCFAGQRQFLRIVSSGVHGREAYFTENPRCAPIPQKF